jgi:hypothetical protein
MRERDAQAVLLVRAVEEADTAGTVLPEHERVAATSRALDGMVVEQLAARQREEVLGRRARTLLDKLEQRHPLLQRILASIRAGAAPTVVACAVALALGLATNLLGPHKKINLLAAPLLGLLAWNLLVYLAMPLTYAVRVVAKRGGAGSLSRRGPIVAWLSGLLVARPSGSLVRRITERDDRSTPAAVFADALIEFFAGWRRAAGPLLAARTRRMLHLAALAMVAGAVGGVYLRGIAFEYRVTWESTLLDAQAVQALLGVVLGPAALLLGVSIPNVAPLQAPGSGNAAIWIHLYATTAVLLVGLPRAALAAMEGWRARRLAADIPLALDEGYVRRLLAGWRGEALQIAAVPYSVELEARAAEKLRGLLHGFFGARSHVELHESTPYGAEIDAALPGGEQGGIEPRRRCRVVLFNLAQTPESEVQGQFLRRLKLQAQEHDEDLLVLVDSSRYRASVSSAQRWRERMNAWREVAAHAGLDAVEVDLSRGDEVAQEMLNALAGALWSRGED